MYRVVKFFKWLCIENLTQFYIRPSLHVYFCSQQYYVNCIDYVVELNLNQKLNERNFEKPSHMKALIMHFTHVKQLRYSSCEGASLEQAALQPNQLPTASGCGHDHRLNTYLNLVYG